VKIIDVQQGSADWFHARLGIPTASCFDQIVTPVRCELSKSAAKYAYRLVAERLLNTPAESLEGQQWMERGQELEPAAVRQYEFVQDVETRPVGFITTDDGLLGASPDRLVKGRAIGLEIKCPAPHTQIGYLLDGHNEAYRPQVQGQMLVAELERVDFYAYHPRMPACLIETPRDEAYIGRLAAALAAFNEQLFAMVERARALGLFQAYESVLTPVEKEEAEAIHQAFRADAALREA
jgi:hypothetical protein